MPATLVETTINRLAADGAAAADALNHFRTQMALPPRVYHSEQHVEAVLERIYQWTSDQPSRSLIAAALYHDVIYDAARHDNELRSAVFAHGALTELGVAVSDIVLATNLIMATRYHQPHPQDADEVLLVDADLYILGSSAHEYAAYTAATRTEYGHVAEPDWRTGRRAVMGRFLQRDRIYWGDWPGRDEREAAARENITSEIETLTLLA